MERSGLHGIIDTLHPLEVKLLSAFRVNLPGPPFHTPIGPPYPPGTEPPPPYQGDSPLTGEDLCARSGLTESQIDTAGEWLKTKGLLQSIGEEVTEFISLTEIGARYQREKIPELRIIDLLKRNGKIVIKDLGAEAHLLPEEVSSALGALKEAGVVRVTSGGALELCDTTTVSLFEKIQSFIDTFSGHKKLLSSLSDSEKEIVREHYRKRGKEKGIFRVDHKTVRRYALTEQGKEACHLLSHKEVVGDEISQLTPSLLKEGAWRGKGFRKYDIQLPPPRSSVGRRHPYREFLDSVRWRLVAMGFTEMRGPLVENEFWNMDALYMPQFHPARDIHDVYFVKEPIFSRPIPPRYLHPVSRTHEDGGTTGSLGWRYRFDKIRARRLVLRSQGTSLSARTLAQNPAIPGKYFATARCFRYDQIDATHASDFYQIEGIVLGEDITFRTLLGLLTLFAEELARAKEVKFLPAYFPFTEPSVELHAQHPTLGWLELGGAGLFRPEVTEPLGVTVPVAAWGLGLDRMAMVALGISDIRNLFSPDLDLIRSKVSRR